jgi:uncharacterized protein YjbJ (UPF0337 family)
MGEARLKGSATKITGKVNEGAGNVSGHQKLKREGIFDQIKEKVANAFGGIKDAMKRK